MADRRTILPVSPRKASDVVKPRKRIEDESAIEEVYKMGDVLGKGSFGVVKEVTHIGTDQHYAMKTVNKDKPGSMSIQLLDREIEVLKRVNHSHLIQLIEVFETQKKVFIILEMCRGGELSDELKKKGKLHEEEVRVIMRQLAEAVVYMHSNDMVHRDLKLENILLSTDQSTSEPYNIKVTDFGLSHMKELDGNSDNSMHSRCGTLYYMAPEVLRSKHEYSQLCDVWSMGVIMYALLCGRMPFNGENAGELEESIISGHIKFKEPEWISITEQAKDLIEGMLNIDTVKRFTARQVLEDPWITGSNKQRIDPFKMLMDESPTASPTTRPRTQTSSDVSSDNHPEGTLKHDKSITIPRSTAGTTSGVGTVSTDKTEYSKPHKPSRSKSLNQRPSHSTSKIPSSGPSSSQTPTPGGGGGLKKKHTTASSGQILSSSRPTTSAGMNGGIRQYHGDEPKRKLYSAKR